MNVLLLSGGIDSSAIAFWKRPDTCLTIDYGQPSFLGELRAARAIAATVQAAHHVASVPLYKDPIGTDGYWPVRNQLLISVAAAMFGREANLKILLGVLGTDVHSDCAKPFIATTNELFAVQGALIRVSAPAIDLNERELLSRSNFPLEKLGVTFSCHRSDLPCGDCPGCLKQSRVRTIVTAGA